MFRWAGIGTDMDTVMTMGNSSAITSLIPRQAGRSASSREEDLVAELFLRAQVGPDHPPGAGLNRSSIPAGDSLLQGHIENFGAMVRQDPTPEHVQVLLIAPLTASLSGMRATVDSRAAPAPAALAAEDLVAVEVFEVAGSEDSMVEVGYVAKRLCTVR